MTCHDIKETTKTWNEKSMLLLGKKRPETLCFKWWEIKIIYETIVTWACKNTTTKL